jgi:O-methyltransferase
MQMLENDFLSRALDTATAAIEMAKAAAKSEASTSPRAQSACIGENPLGCRAMYLDLLADCILNMIYEDRPVSAWTGPDYSAENRQKGADWPSIAHSMIGKKRVMNIRSLAETVFKDRIPGDFIETGVWRGGACIFMSGLLKAFNETNRVVWVADSFEGLPRPNADKYPSDAGDVSHTANSYLGVSLETVQSNFQKYGLLTEQVKFLKGWFKDTLPTAPIEHLAILRADGDMYESTMDALVNLYGKLSHGGFVIIDDYILQTCRAAVHDFRARNNIAAPLVDIDETAVYWRKP